MKILVVSNMYPDKLSPSYGIFVKRFCKQLESIGIPYDKSVMHKGNSKIKKVSGYIKFYIGTVFKIIFNKYDLIYVHYASHSSIPVLIASKIKKVRIFTNVHGSDVVPENHKQEKMQKFTKEILKLSDKVIVPSEYFKEYVSKKYELVSNIIEIYPSAGVNKNLFNKYDEEKKNRIRKKYSIKKDEVVIGYVGRITKGKGWDTFIKGLDYFCKMNKSYNIKVLLVGSGIEEANLNQVINTSCIKDKIIRFQLLPECELANIYNMLDLFVFPTEREGESLGLVALEAMACGVPVIASDFAAPKYYVKNEYNGYKYEVGNYKEMGKCIKHYLMLDKEKQMIISDNAHITAKAYFEESIIKKLKLILCSISESSK